MGLKFITPANIMIIGPSLSGKSTMMFNIFNIFNILDNLMEQISKSVTCQDLVTKITHHCEISLFILTQNMFQKGPIFRCVSLNTHYFIIMKTKRDQQQLLHFGRQISPSRLIICMIHI